MKTDKEIREAIKQIRDFMNTEVFRCLVTEEGKKIWSDRLKVLRWVLEEG